MQAASIQDALGTHGECPIVRWNGNEYRLGHPTQRAKARFEEAVVQAEQRAIEALTGRAPQSVVDARWDRLGGQIDRREYATGGELWRKYVGGSEAVAGVSMFAWCLFAENHPTIKLDDVRAMTASDSPGLRLALRRVTADFLDLLLDTVKDPIQRAMVTDRAGPMMQEIRQLFADPAPAPETPSDSTPSESTEFWRANPS